MEPRYPMLGNIARLYQFAGLLIGVGSIFLAVMSILSVLGSRSSFAVGGAIAGSLSSVLIGVISGVGLYAFGELINLLRDMEFNSRLAAHHAELTEQHTRLMAETLGVMLRRQQQAARQTPPPQA